MRIIDNYLRLHAPGYAVKEKTNLRYPMAMFISSYLVGTLDITANLFADTSLDEIDSSLLKASTNHTWQLFEELKRIKSIDGDLVAKNKEFDQAVLQRLEAIINGEIHLELHITPAKADG